MTVDNENTVDYWSLSGSMLGFILFRKIPVLIIPALISGRLLGKIAGRNYLANKEKFMNGNITDSIIKTKIQENVKTV